MFLNTGNKKIRFFFISLNVVLLTIIILLTPLSCYVFNIDYYGTLFEKNGVFDILDKSDVLDTLINITDFFKYRFDLKTLYQDTIVRPAFDSENGGFSFTANEVSHLYDVRVLLTRIFITYYAAILLFLIITMLLIKRNSKSILYITGLMFIASSILSVVLILILYLAGKNFPLLFDNFHGVFFPQGNYSFVSGSLLITLFPAGFFYDFFVRIITCSVIAAFILLASGLFFIFMLKLSGKHRREMI